MKKKDVELFAFMYFCSSEDRDLLLGKKPFSYEEFRRITYIVDFFGFYWLLCDIWERFSEPFLDELEQLEKFLLRDDATGDVQDEIDAFIKEDIQRHNDWIAKFCMRTKGRNGKNC